jgi:hypothetical protein
VVGKEPWPRKKILREPCAERDRFQLSAKLVPSYILEFFFAKHNETCLAKSCFLCSSEKKNDELLLGLINQRVRQEPSQRPFSDQ